MNPEIKAQWVAALRSEEYDQGQGTLKVVDSDGKAKYCCLGVLCDLAEKANVTTSHQVVSGEVLYGKGYDCFPPREVWEWAELPNDNPVVRGDDNNETALVDLNDNGMSFSDIADLIEGNL